MPVLPTDYLKMLNFKNDRNNRKTNKKDKNVCSTDNTDVGLKVTRRKLPHWTLRGSTYFITFRTAQGELTIEEQKLVLENVLKSNEKFYKLIAVVVMPDHIHLLLMPVKKYSLSRIMKGIKGTTARQINLKRGSSGSIWIEESFDRIIRDQKELDEKLN